MLSAPQFIRGYVIGRRSASQRFNGLFVLARTKRMPDEGRRPHLRPHKRQHVSRKVGGQDLFAFAAADRAHEENRLQAEEVLVQLSFAVVYIDGVGIPYIAIGIAITGDVNLIAVAVFDRDLEKVQPFGIEIQSARRDPSSR